MPRTASRKSSLIRFLDESSQPVYFIDRNRRVLFCNEALVTAFDKSIDEIMGAACAYYSQPSDSDGLNGLCPPESAFGTAPSDGVVHFPSSNGPIPRSAHFCPVSGGSGSNSAVQGVAVQGVMVIVGENLPPTKLDTEDLAIRHDSLHAEIWQLRRHLRGEFQIDALIGRSPAMGRVRDQVRFAAECPFSVVVCGPVGSGQERIARTVHATAPTANLTPLVPLAATVLDADLLRTTIDAYIKRFAELETDEGPTLLLLDADQLAEDAQLELLGFMAIDELGLRTLATTCTPLIELAQDGKFQPVLAQRLSTMVVTLPDLRNRPEDIPLLAQYLVEQLNERERRHIDGFSPAAIEQLMAYPWSRNVDELKEVVDECYRQSAGPIIDADKLPARIRIGLDAVLNPLNEPVTMDLELHLHQVERAVIESALLRSGGNKTQAAKMLSISRGRLLRRIEQLKIDG